MDKSPADLLLEELCKRHNVDNWGTGKQLVKNIMKEYGDLCRKKGAADMLDKIPTSWLHPMFTPFLKKESYSPYDIEQMFIALKKELKKEMENNHMKGGKE